MRKIAVYRKVLGSKYEGQHLSTAYIQDGPAIQSVPVTTEVESDVSNVSELSIDTLRPRSDALNSLTWDGKANSKLSNPDVTIAVSSS